MGFEESFNGTTEAGSQHIVVYDDVEFGTLIHQSCAAGRGKGSEMGSREISWHVFQFWRRSQNRISPPNSGAVQPGSLLLTLTHLAFSQRRLVKKVQIVLSARCFSLSSKLRFYDGALLRNICFDGITCPFPGYHALACEKTKGYQELTKRGMVLVSVGIYGNLAWRVRLQDLDVITK
jgi:hypothetical protein